MAKNNLEKALEVIKNASFGNSKVDKVNSELRELISQKTNGFKNATNISDVKVDMTDIIKQQGYTIADYKRVIGDVNRSEEDVVLALADRCNNSGDSEDLSEEDIMELEMMAMAQEQEQEAIRLRTKK